MAEILDRRRFLTLGCSLLALVYSNVSAIQIPVEQEPGFIDSRTDRAFTLASGRTRLKVVITGATPDLPSKDLLAHIEDAAQAVRSYYGRFPVRSAEILVTVVPDRSGVLSGTTWGHMDAYPAVTRLRIGQHTTMAELRADWIVTHEFVHMALPSLPDANHWLEEGLATYIEPIARAQIGQLTQQEAWAGMLDGMHNGEPQPLDRGLDRTHTWGRTYWGGALFCLTADIEIRKQTRNAYGLQDALRSIVNAGGSIDKAWPIEQVLSTGDHATQTSVLEDLYRQWSQSPVTVDLALLWRHLGVGLRGDTVVFDNTAPLASIRKRIMAPDESASVP